MVKKVKLVMSLEIPVVPNLIQSKDGKVYPIACFDVALLRAIGKQWTNNLVKKATSGRALRNK